MGFFLHHITNTLYTLNTALNEHLKNVNKFQNLESDHLTPRNFSTTTENHEYVLVPLPTPAFLKTPSTLLTYEIRQLVQWIKVIVLISR